MNVLCAEKLYQGERTAAQEVERQSRGKREEMVRRLKEPFVKSAVVIAGDGLDRQRQMVLQQKGERRTDITSSTWNNASLRVGHHPYPATCPSRP